MSSAPRFPVVETCGLKLSENHLFFQVRIQYIIAKTEKKSFAIGQWIDKRVHIGQVCRLCADGIFQFREKKKKIQRIHRISFVSVDNLKFHSINHHEIFNCQPQLRALAGGEKPSTVDEESAAEFKSRCRGGKIFVEWKFQGFISFPWMNGADLKDERVKRAKEFTCFPRLLARWYPSSHLCVACCRRVEGGNFVFFCVSRHRD